jgi:hypothetical protein
MKKSTTPPLQLIGKIAIAITFLNTWVIFEETVVDRYGLWRYMPYYRVGLFCAWDFSVLAITLLLLVASVARLRRRDGPTQSTTPPLPLIGKIAIAIAFINMWVIFEETVVDRTGLWRYMPYYRVGLFCAWDAAVLAITLLLLLVSLRPLRRRGGPTQSATLPSPLIGKIAIAMTFINMAVSAFVWPGVLLRVCL